MYEIKCDDCDYNLVFDYGSTLDSCLKDLDYLRDSKEFIQDKWLSNYLVYRCVNCRKKFKYTFKEVERKVRETVSKDVIQFRKVQMFKKIDHSLVDPDNGFEYCGQCEGVDKQGNCFVDIIKQCTIRNEL